jgi:5-methylcytosine-specific restriction endonuclease McrA
MLCSFGCGKEAEYTLKNSKLCCARSPNSCSAIRLKNSSGLEKAYQDGRKGTSQLDGKRGWSKDKNLVSNDEIFIDNSIRTNDLTKARIIKEKLLAYCCSECKITDWNNKPLAFELDHINGINNDNRLENLRFLCLNCHSQTSTFRSKNINKSKKVADSDLLTAYQEHKNISQALISVGLVAKGANYSRIMKLIAKHLGIDK